MGGRIAATGVEPSFLRGFVSAAKSAKVEIAEAPS
jgi:hypothetical protein